MHLCVSYGSHNNSYVSLHSTNRLLFVAETYCVSCEIGTQFLYAVEKNFSL
jgi:hypothetical protein